MIRRSPLMYALDLPGFGFSDRAEYSLTGGDRRLDHRRQRITKRLRYQAKEETCHHLSMSMPVRS